MTGHRCNNCGYPDPSVDELALRVSNLELERRVLRRELSEAELTIRGLRGALASLAGRR